MTTHEKALEAARDVARYEYGVILGDAGEAAISAYVSALTTPDVDGLVDELKAFSIHPLMDRAATTLTRLAAENALLREREGWKPIETAPKDKTRVILAWTTPENLPPHIEFGYWSDIKASWVNTYGNPFCGSPDIWFTPPFPASPSHQEQRT